MVVHHQETYQMKIDHGDITIDDNSLSILRLLRDRRDTGPATDGGTAVHGAKTKEMVETTDLSRGSVHYRVTTKLQPKGLVEVIGTEQGNGAVEDAQIWGLTEKGQEWIDSLNTEDLPPAAASSEAAETAREARRLANQTLLKHQKHLNDLDEAAERIHPANVNDFWEWMGMVGEAVVENKQGLKTNREYFNENLDKAVSSDDLATVRETANSAATADSLADTTARIDDLSERIDRLDGGGSGTGIVPTISRQLGSHDPDTYPIEDRIPTTQRELINLEDAADSAESAITIAKVATIVAAVAVVVALVALTL